MIPPMPLQQLMTAMPFRPFRIHLSEGSHYDIHHPDAASVEQIMVDIGVNPDSDGIADQLFHRAISLSLGVGNRHSTRYGSFRRWR
jgi:hypothetical protein